MWKKTIGIDGVEYDSMAEARVAEWLAMHGVRYEPHKRLPSPASRKQSCDFYLPDHELWVEYDGLQEVRADSKLTRKQKFYKQYGLKYLTITREDWERDLFEAIFTS